MAYRLHIVTPDGEIFDSQVDSMVAKTVLGDVCLLTNHSDIVTVIDVGQVKITQNGESRYGACSGGLLSMKAGVCSLVATTFEFAEDIDGDRAANARDRAMDRINSAPDSKQEALYKAKLKRALCRLTVKDRATGLNNG